MMISRKPKPGLHERNWSWWLVCGDDCDLYWQPTPVQLHVNRSAKYGNNEQNKESRGKAIIFVYSKLPVDNHSLLNIIICCQLIIMRDAAWVWVEHLFRRDSASEWWGRWRWCSSDLKKILWHWWWAEWKSQRMASLGTTSNFSRIIIIRQKSSLNSFYSYVY